MMTSIVASWTMSKNQKKADKQLKPNLKEQSATKKNIMHIKNDTGKHKKCTNAEIIGHGLGSQCEINVF